MISSQVSFTVTMASTEGVYAPGAALARAAYSLLSSWRLDPTEGRQGCWSTIERSLRDDLKGYF